MVHGIDTCVVHMCYTASTHVNGRFRHIPCCSFTACSSLFVHHPLTVEDGPALHDEAHGAAHSAQGKEEEHAGTQLGVHVARFLQHCWVWGGPDLQW